MNELQPDFQLIETMRWQPETGILRRPQHLRRLAASAQQLGFPFDTELVAQQLAGICSGNDPLRLRLTLARDGAVTVTSAMYQPVPAGAIWRVAIAATRLDSRDPLLRHKTTRRQSYLAARAEFDSAEIDEVILLNERDEVCEGTITSLFIGNDASGYRTPALSCGLLDGVLRSEKLDNGVASEAVLTVSDLRHAGSLWLGNSLRGLIAARLLP